MKNLKDLFGQPSIYLFIGLGQILVGAHGIFNFDMWDLVPLPGIEPRPPALGVQRLATGSPRKSSNQQFF